MTKTAKKLIAELEKLPEEEQEEFATSYLQDLQRRKQREEGQVEPYASFQVLKNAKFEGEPDESTTYEETLYGLNEGDE